MEALNEKRHGSSVVEKTMTNEEKTYFSNKLQEAEAFDAVHKETYSLDDIINKHREKYGI